MIIKTNQGRVCKVNFPLCYRNGHHPEFRYWTGCWKVHCGPESCRQPGHGAGQQCAGWSVRLHWGRCGLQRSSKSWRRPARYPGNTGRHPDAAQWVWDLILIKNGKMLIIMWMEKSPEALHHNHGRNPVRYFIVQWDPMKNQTYNCAFIVQLTWSVGCCVLTNCECFSQNHKRYITILGWYNVCVCFGWHTTAGIVCVIVSK